MFEGCGQNKIDEHDALSSTLKEKVITAPIIVAYINYDLDGTVGVGIVTNSNVSERVLRYGNGHIPDACILSRAEVVG